MNGFVGSSWARVALLLISALFSEARAENGIPAITRVLPPVGGIELPPDLKKTLTSRVTALSERLWEIEHKAHVSDVGVIVKAVDFALRHGEFYSEKEIPLASEMLDLAELRFKELEEKESPAWLGERGLVIRGYRSKIDDSDQPYGLEIPAALDLSKPVPLLVWLHGRGDKTTDLHFLNQCRKKSQAFGGFMKDQGDAIILHPFGRHCVGWKHAGEIDVFEAIEAVAADYPIDRDRIILAGFSMGGAGAWHIGVHYRDHFCAVHTGAGFAETREYNKLTPEKYPPDFEQTLWKVYDVPNYVRNFSNGPLLAYSGEKDKQKAAADLMEREMVKESMALRHVIGPGLEHKYNQESVDVIRKWLQESWKVGRTRPALKIEWQTPTLRYSNFDWMRITGLEAHWKDSRVSAKWEEDKKTIRLDLKGVTAFEINPRPVVDLSGITLAIGDQTLQADRPGFPVDSLSVIRREGRWTWGEPEPFTKKPGLQGPIDDAFMSRFLVVPPDHAPSHPKVARWIDFELNHFRDRWSALMRGDLPEKAADEVDSDDLAGANLILWGDPASNPLIAEMIARLPVEWRDGSFVFRGETYSATGHVPVLIFPNPLNPERYVVINSGLTFREGHDKTNSLQNPKLPDWAVIGLDQDPDAFAPGRIVKAGFFDENWK
ncbi:MAG: prolyl oligopeptidase family serine peptidase [Verrucomicrobiales bacterium]